MRNKLLLALATLLFVACGNRVAPAELAETAEEEIQTQSSVVDPQNRQDTVYFGYILGQSTKNVTRQLINKKELKSRSVVRKQLVFSIEGFAQSVEAKGYPFDLYIADKKYDALLSLYDIKGSLIQNDG